MAHKYTSDDTTAAAASHTSALNYPHHSTVHHFDCSKQWFLGEKSAKTAVCKKRTETPK